MRTVVDRAYEIAAAVLLRAPRDRLAHPFGFGEHPPYRWRLSKDVWDALSDHVGTNEASPTVESRLLGEPVELDLSLPANSMMLVPVSYPYEVGSLEVRIDDSHPNRQP